MLLPAFSGTVPGESLAASILVFRATDYILPLGLALDVLSRFGMSRRTA